MSVVANSGIINYLSMLPDEILGSIMSFCDKETWAFLQHTSHRLCELSKTHRSTELVYECVFRSPKLYMSVLSPNYAQQNRTVVVLALSKDPQLFLSGLPEGFHDDEIRKTAYLASLFLHMKNVEEALCCYDSSLPLMKRAIQESEKSGRPIEAYCSYIPYLLYAKAFTAEKCRLAGMNVRLPSIIPVARALICKDPDLFRSLDSSLQDNKLFVLEAISKKCSLFFSVSSLLRRSPDVQAHFFRERQRQEGANRALDLATACDAEGDFVVTSKKRK